MVVPFCRVEQVEVDASSGVQHGLLRTQLLRSLDGGQGQMPSYGDKAGMV